MTEYTIIEPGFEFIKPSDNYLEFLEICTRTCYKSEEHIKIGSAEKLLSKVVKEYEHLSVTEHVSCIMDIESNEPVKILHNILSAADPVHFHVFPGNPTPPRPDRGGAGNRRG